MNQTLIYGSEKNGLILTFQVAPGGQIGFNKIELTLNGAVQPINDLTDSMHVHLTQYVKAEIDKQSKYRRLEELFLKNLRKTIKIETDHQYEIFNWEYMKLTKDPNEEHDELQLATV